MTLHTTITLLSVPTEISTDGSNQTTQEFTTELSFSGSGLIAGALRGFSNYELAKRHNLFSGSEAQYVAAVEQARLESATSASLAAERETNAAASALSAQESEAALKTNIARSFTFNQYESKVFRIFHGVDSLTDGAGGNGGRDGDSYVNGFSDAIRAQFGDAGKGWTSFDNRVAQREGMHFQRSQSFSYIKTLPRGESPSKYSLDFGGVHAESPAVGDFVRQGWVNSVKDRNWDTATLYYLQQPGGATFGVAQTGSGNVEISVDSDGELSLQSVTITKDQKLNNDIKARVTAGGVCTVFGIDWKLNVERGVSCSRLAFGGYQTAYFANELDQTFQEQWFSELAPTHYMMCTGRNDVGNFTPEDYIANVEKYLGFYPTDTKKLLIAPCESSTDETSDIRAYRVELSELAESESYGYIDDSVTLGTYASANANGLMLDETHPSALGNQARTQSYLKLCGVTQTSYKIPQTYAAPDQYYGEVGGGSVFGLAAGTSATLIEIQPNDALSGIFIVEIALKTSTSTAMILDRVTFRTLGGAEGAFATVGSSQTTRIHTEAITGGTVSYTTSLVDGNAKLNINSDAGNTGTIQAAAKVTFVNTIAFNNHENLAVII